MERLLSFYNMIFGIPRLVVFVHGVLLFQYFLKTVLGERYSAPQVRKEPQKKKRCTSAVACVNKITNNFPEIATI